MVGYCLVQDPHIKEQFLLSNHSKNKNNVIYLEEVSIQPHFPSVKIILAGL